MNRSFTLACGLLGVFGTVAAAQNLLPNPSFEDFGPGFVIVDGWTNFTTPVDVINNGDPIANGGGTFMAQDGSRAVAFFAGGNGLNNQADTVYGVDFNNDTFEDFIPVTPGEAYTLSGWAYNPSTAPLVERTGSNATLDRIGSSFYAIANFNDANGDRLDRVRFAIYEGREGRVDTRQIPLDTWDYWESEPLVAPAGSVEVQYVLVLVTWGDPGSVTYIDNVFFGVAGGGGCNDADLAEPFGILDLADITAFVGAFTANDPIADFNGDMVFDLSDINAFVGAFLAGCP